MRFVSGLALAVAGVLAAAPALAGPFAEVGDRQLRQDVELLKAAGLIRGPIDSWPLPWAQIDGGLDVAHDGRQLDPYLQAAVNRLDRLSDLAAHKIVIDARVDATNNVSLARDFGSLARAKFDSAASVEFNGDTVSLDLGVGVRSGQGGHAYNFEPSQVAVRLGNWALYAGWTEEWFGPGQDGALLYSNSTRPFPKIGLKRLMPDPINLPVLRWLGPIRLDFFVGVLDEKRADYNNIITVGTRLSFAPSQGWEIGFNRTQMLCGDGHACGLHQIVTSFIGIGNSDNPQIGSNEAFFNQAGNQIAGFDVSYQRRFGKVAAKLYFEGEAEDFDNIILEQFSRLIGTKFWGPWGNRGAVWTANVEYTDTLAVSLFNGTPLEKLTGGETQYPASMYNNGLFFKGYTYNALPIGYWGDGDSRTLTFSGSLTDLRNRRWYASARSVHLNITNTGNPPLDIIAGGIPQQYIYRVSRNSEKFAILTGGVEMPTRVGDLRLEARYQTDSPNTPDERKPKFGVEVQFRQRF